MLESIRDPNGVLTAFEYDTWGQLYRYGEGEVPETLRGSRSPGYVLPKAGKGGRVRGACAAPVEPVEAGGDYERARSMNMMLEFRYLSDSGSRVHSAKWESAGSRSTGGAGTNYDLVNRVTDTWCPPMLTEPLGSAFAPEGFPKLPCDAPFLLTGLGWLDQAEYDGMGRLEEADFAFELRIGDNVFDSWMRNYIDDYDEIGMLTSSAIHTSEPGPVITRAFSYNLDWSAGTYTRVGPDGVETFVELDDASRVEYVRRGPVGDPTMMATYDYYADGLVHSVTYGNGTSIWYEYDAARRLTWIRHKGPLGYVLLQLNYEYNDRDEVERIIESSVATGVVIVELMYDNRGRLIHGNSSAVCNARQSRKMLE